MIIFALYCVLLLQSVDAHGYLKSPRSRNFVAYEEGVWYGGTSNDTPKESCPHCLNRGGSAASCGKVDGRNYDYPQNVFGNPLPWETQTTYHQGAIVDLEVVLTAHHKGHFVFKACPLSESQVPDEDCFNAHPLEFVSDELYFAPKDENFPNRAYIAPPQSGIFDSSGVYGMLFHYRFRLPMNVSGRVLLQWKYYTANSCVYEGYDTYPFPSASWTSGNLGVCENIPSDGNGVPEMFWNCAEIFVDGQQEPTAAPTISPSVSPTDPIPTAPITSSPTKTPTTPNASPTSPPNSSPQKKTVVGYYASWQVYDRNYLGKPENMDFTKVDRVNFAFFQPDTLGNLYGTDSWGDPIVLYGPYNYNPQPGAVCFNSWTGPGVKTCNYHDYEKGLIHLVHNAGAQIYPSIGGWTLSSNFPTIAASATARENFANQCVDLIKDYDFDGIDIDWEYPGYANHQGTPQDKLNFNLLLNEIRAKLDGLAVETGKYYGLTAALPCGPSNIDNMDIPHVSSVLDELLLMTYDLHGPWEPVTGVNAPLYYQGFGDNRLSVDGCVDMWKSNGAPSSKISIGMAFYGRGFKNASALNQSHQGVDTINWSDDDGLPQYFNIMNGLSTGQLTSYRHEASKTPYAYFQNGSGFVSYDNERSICEKTEYVIENGLNGFLIWELSGDLMSDLTTPLLDSMNKKLSNPDMNCDGETSTPSPLPLTNEPTFTPSKAPITTPTLTTQEPTEVPTIHQVSPTKSPVAFPPTVESISCPGGYTGLKAADQCTKYYHCVNGIVTPADNPLLPCPGGTLFDEGLQFCNWSDQVQCTVGQDPTPTMSPTMSPPTPVETINCPTGYTGLRAAEQCTKYYHCVIGIVTPADNPLLPCPPGTLFDEQIQVCNWDYNVNCNANRHLRKRRI